MNEKEAGIIQPRKNRSDPVASPDAVMVMVRSQLNRITGKFGARKQAFSEAHLYDFFQAAPDSCSTVTICGPFFGAPHAVMGLEKIIALGAERIWVLGWCGALDPRLSIGDIVIPTKAFPEEGTSSLYTNRLLQPAADASLLSMIEAAVQEKHLQAARGPIWTTDALYRETPSKVRAYRTLGALAVEMELSALMSAAMFRSVALAALLVVSDKLSPEGWRPGFSDRRLAEGSQCAASVIMELAAKAGSR